MFVLILTVVGTGLLYVLVAKFINENNAKNWLSGYNTMSKRAQEKFDLKGYLIFFKSFFYRIVSIFNFKIHRFWTPFWRSNSIQNQSKSNQILQQISEDVFDGF